MQYFWLRFLLLSIILLSQSKCTSISKSNNSSNIRQMELTKDGSYISTAVEEVDMINDIKFVFE